MNVYNICTHIFTYLLNSSLKGHIFNLIALNKFLKKLIKYTFQVLFIYV